MGPPKVLFNTAFSCVKIKSFLFSSNNNDGTNQFQIYTYVECLMFMQFFT
jgi:hypothetical protein